MGTVIIGVLSILALSVVLGVRGAKKVDEDDPTF